MSSLKDSFSDVLALAAGTALLLSSAPSVQVLEDVVLGLLAVLAVALLAVRPARLSALRHARLLNGRGARRHPRNR